MTEMDPEKIPFPEFFECNRCETRFEKLGDELRCPQCEALDVRRVRKVVITSPESLGHRPCPVCKASVRAYASITKKYYGSENTEPYIVYRTGITYECKEHYNYAEQNVEILKRP